VKLLGIRRLRARLDQGLELGSVQQGRPERQRKDLNKISRELNSLGGAYRALGEFDAARELFVEAIALSRQSRDLEREANAVANLSLIESDIGNHERAIDLVERRPGDRAPARGRLGGRRGHGQHGRRVAPFRSG
jgi:tetratricopeptide (TPR) repeat protein